ncbi:hypothetical protein ScFU53_07810 [Streptococcus canis]|uniref:Na+ driven multidrug efflux pump n=1 Tax=Streptococcus canis FSL Z3-227 TaxID=482234 RepID=A0AAV3FSC1_STRCB|nr:hypothetical protein [Streptococcus canis]EIQ82020.1 Na+ driven multidrug efflux pump [Streptococcus canis FSL Z3-227]MDV5988006.1 multidrug transporter [Streptococcus canis]MDV5993099.1 multidrug transporter [Streptococcus canis]MDV6001244.1 multidrug transporter [Streptococcus canis]MDV6022410.1 multidrug transporter [Streptococcus canis]
MINAIPTLVLLNPNNSLEDKFIKGLAEYFSHLFDLTMIGDKDAITSSQLSDFQAIFSFYEHDFDLPTLYFKTSNLGLGFLIDENLFDRATDILAVTQYLTKFYQKFDGQFLHYLPLQARVADKNGDILVNNHAFNGSFFQNTDKQIEPWIMADLTSSGDTSISFLLPSGSLDHIYMQHYQALKNAQGQILGIFDTIQDIKPLLSQYLEETGQAIVGWSDVTSGPSISDN